MKLDNSLLHYFVRDALVPHHEDFVVRDKRNPVIIQFNGIDYSIHISYVHDSGANRDNEDEIRIQISSNLIEQQKQRHNKAQNVAFIGFFEDGKTFVAWDPRHIFSLEATTTVSVYARRSQEESVKTQLAATHQFHAQLLQKDSLAIALPANTLGFYLENIAHFHQVKSENTIQSLIRDHNDFIAQNPAEIRHSIEPEHGVERERFTLTRKAYPRDPRFRELVLDAYNHACCVCERQLKIVQAAHIIPHSEKDCPNTINNGLALCIEHHRLYDDALLLPGPGNRLVFNQERAEYLRQTNQERGLNEIESQHNQEFSIPERTECHPSDDYLRRGLEIRLGK